MPLSPKQAGSTEPEEDSASASQATPVSILKGAKTVLVHQRPSLLRSTDFLLPTKTLAVARIADQVSAKPPTWKARTTEEETDTVEETLECPQSPFQSPRTETSSPCLHEPERTTDRSTEATTLTADSPLQQPVSDDCHPWPLSQSYPMRVASLQQALDQTPYQVNKVKISYQGQVHRQEARDHCETSPVWLAGQSEIFSKGLGSPESGMKTAGVEKGTNNQLPVSRSGKAQSVLSRKKSTKQPSHDLYLDLRNESRSTSSKPLALRQQSITPKPHRRDEHSTTKTWRIFEASDRDAVSSLSTAERATGVRTRSRPPSPTRQIHQCLTAGSLRSSRDRSSMRSSRRGSTSTSRTGSGRSTERSSTRSGSGTMLAQEDTYLPTSATSGPTSAPLDHSFRCEGEAKGQTPCELADTCTQKTISKSVRDDYPQETPVEDSQLRQSRRDRTTLVPRHGTNDPCMRHCRQQRQSWGDGITKDTVGRLSRSRGPGDERLPHIPFSDYSNSPCVTAVESDSESDSDTISDDAGREDTPLTSPNASPMKAWLTKYSDVTWTRHQIAQLDGPGDGDRNESAVRDDPGETGANGAHLERASRRPSNSYSRDEISSQAPGDPFQRRSFSTVDSLAGSTSEADVFETALDTPASDRGDDEITPLVAPSPAKGAASFPFPRGSTKPMPERMISRIRHPSALLKQCEGLATSRQRRLLNGGSRTPDRFVPLRSATPTKESLFLTTPTPKLSIARIGAGRWSPPADPFGPTPRHSLRLTDRTAIVRSPAPPARPHGLRPTTVFEASSSTRRSASAGTVWSVGGTTTTEGVASITNSRGGRVTSGTSAPHYAADFLRRNTPSEEELTHGRRLALAMEIDQTARMVDHSLPSSPSSASPRSSGKKHNRVWQNGTWEDMSSPLTPTKTRTKKTREIPIIPFRVLDAPALRDNYYCSLLAYSPTVDCLAVSLGAQVYLWKEKKARESKIPDSLTVPAGTAHITSLSFSSVEGGSAILAIGRANGRITLWSPLDGEARFNSEQPSPVSCVTFRPRTVQRSSMRDPSATVATEELLAGDEVGFVYYYSIEWPDQHHRDLFDWHGSMTLLARITCHTQQICGLAWSSDGAYFASGGNDNQMYLFETKKALTHPPAPTRHPAVRVRGPSASFPAIAGQRAVIALSATHARHTFALNAAVKALAFAPWQPTLLAAGGGSNDRCIHFLHALSGATLATIDCHAQVTSLVWSTRRRQLAATFGFAQPEHPHRVAVFAWPSCDLLVKIPWFTEERALFALPYPRGPMAGAMRADREGGAWYGRRTREEGCLVVATSDASIKFHEIWAEERGKRVGESEGVLGGSQILEGECSEGLVRREAIR